MDKIKEVRCENPNCRTAFALYELCHACKKMFCGPCLANCDTCGNRSCKFCMRTDYSKFKDLQICPYCQ